MVTQHQHKPGSFDPGHCRGCAHQADLLDHYWQVQREEQAFKEATGGPGGPTGTPAGRCGLPASGWCWQSSPCSPADPPLRGDPRRSHRWATRSASKGVL